MKRFLQCVIAVAAVLTTMSMRPVIDKELNFPRCGDVLTLRDVSYADTAGSGENRIWDLSGVDESGKKTLRFESAGRDSLSCIVGRTRYLYYVCGDTLLCGGFENNLSDMVYEKAEAVLISTFDYGRSISGEFLGSGRYADRMQDERSGHYHTEADARGVMITPDGDTIPGVLRLVTERYSRNLFFRGESADGSWSTDSLPVYEKECRWYAPGHRYPLLMTKDVFTLANSRQASHMARYVSLNEQESAADPENEAILLRNAADTVYGRNTTAEPPVSIIDYTLTQDKAAQTVTIRYSVIKPVDLMFVLSDIGGIVYRSEERRCKPDEEAEITFDYGGLPFSGAYGITISGGNERHSEKFYR